MMTLKATPKLIQIRMLAGGSRPAVAHPFAAIEQVKIPEVIYFHEMLLAFILYLQSYVSL